MKVTGCLNAGFVDSDGDCRDFGSKCCPWFPVNLCDCMHFTHAPVDG